MDEQMTMQSPGTREELETRPISECAVEEVAYDEDAELSAETNDTAEPEVSIDADGEVKFGEEFFGDAGMEPEPVPEAPKYYTADELRTTPYEQWEIERLNGDIKEFVPIVREQMQRRAVVSQMTNPTVMPPFLQEVRQYTPKELSDEAQSLAVEKLGLSDADDFDEYDGEHRAALDMARAELLERRSGELARYQRSLSEFRQLQRFNAELAMQSDFGEFERWFGEKLTSKGIRPEQVEAGLQEYARQSGGNYGAVQGVIAGWYQAYRKDSSQRAGVERTKRPPVLESSGGSGYEGRRTMNLRELGELDADGQAQALMRLGIV